MTLPVGQWSKNEMRMNNSHMSKMINVNECNHCRRRVAASSVQASSTASSRPTMQTPRCRACWWTRALWTSWRNATRRGGGWWGRLSRQVCRERRASSHTLYDALCAAGVAAPGMTASLAYFDGYRRASSPANLVQAQRDYFGSHTYERVDKDGAFHTLWSESNSADSITTSGYIT